MVSNDSLKYNLPEIFNEDLRLNLLIWNRLDKKLNDLALNFVKEIMTDSFIGDKCLLMIRPLGRMPGDYEKYSFAEKYPPLIDSQTNIKILPGGRTGHCELWININGTVETVLFEKIKTWIDNQNIGIVFRAITNPLWTPLSHGACISECEYASANHGKAKKQMCALGEELAPSVLKLIWARSTEAIIKYFVNEGIVKELCPNDGLQLSRIMSEILSDIKLSYYGVNGLDEDLDPSMFGVSHMAAFALNAVTPITQHNGDLFYGLENYLSKNIAVPSIITRPFYFGRDEYLNFLKNIK